MVYAQGGAISSPSTPDTDQPTAWMSSATARMQASGSRSMPSAIASHSAHRHRWSGGFGRRLRGGFMPSRYEGGMTFSGAPSGAQTAGKRLPAASEARIPLADHRTPPEWVDDLAARFSALAIHPEAPPAPNHR